MSSPHTSSLARWRHRLLGSTRSDVAYRLLVGALTALLIAPIWIGVTAPLSDFTGHAAMAHVWIHYDEIPAYRELFELAPWSIPNLIPMHFAKLLAPWLNPVNALRLFLTISLLLTVLTLHGVAQTYGRNRWLILFALPFLWNSSLSMGFVNYLPIFPLLFYTITLTERLAKEPSRAKVLLAFFNLGFVAYWVHGMGWGVILGTSGLLALLRWPPRRWPLLAAAWAPSTALWCLWYAATRATSKAGYQGTLPELDSAEGLSVAIEYPIALRRFALFIEEGMEIFTLRIDTNVFAGLLGAFFVLCVGAAHGEGVPSETHEAPAHNPLQWLRQFVDFVRRSPLLVLVLIFGASIYLLPKSINNVILSPRFVAPFYMLAPFVLRIRRLNASSQFALSMAAVLALTLGVTLLTVAHRFKERELDPMAAAFAHVPEGARVDCVGVNWITATFSRWPLMHTCRGFAHLLRGSLGNGGFARDSFNAVRFRPGQGVSELDAYSFSVGAHVQEWEYLVVRGNPPGVPELLEHVASYTADKPKTAVYSTYRVRRWPEYRAGAGFWHEGAHMCLASMGHDACPDPFVRQPE